MSGEIPFLSPCSTGAGLGSFSHLTWAMLGQKVPLRCDTGARLVPDLIQQRTLLPLRCHTSTRLEADLFFKENSGTVHEPNLKRTYFSKRTQVPFMSLT